MRDREPGKGNWESGNRLEKPGLLTWTYAVHSSGYSGALTPPKRGLKGAWLLLFKCPKIAAANAARLNEEARECAIL